MGNSNDARTANLLAAAVLGLDDALREAVTEATGLDLAAATAMVAMLDFTPAGSVLMLSRVVGLTHSGTVRLVDRLVALGYADRGDGPDARSRTVRLTRPGRVLARKARRARAAVLQEVLLDLKPQQRQAISDLSAILIGGIARRRRAERAEGSVPPVARSAGCVTSPPAAAATASCPATWPADRPSQRPVSTRQD